jgi:hypothetical protein
MLPVVRAIVTDFFTALMFAQKPYYLKRIQELQNRTTDAGKI